jgi:hypothetical protein
MHLQLPGGFAFLPSAPIRSCLRDGDHVLLLHSIQAQSLPGQGRPQQQHKQQEHLVPAASPQWQPSHSGAQHQVDSQEVPMPAAKRVRFNPAPALDAVAGQHRQQQLVDGVQAAAPLLQNDVQGPGAGGGDSEVAPVKKASRSARRKALKRRLRRTGVLPYTPGMCSRPALLQAQCKAGHMHSSLAVCCPAVDVQVTRKQSSRDRSRDISHHRQLSLRRLWPLSSSM